MPRKPFPWRLGADPEFSILLDGRRCDASAIFGRFKKNNAERTDNGFKEEGMKGNIGWDGCATTAEIRPDASDTADGLVSNIRSLLTPVLPRLPAFDFSTLSLSAPIGGHIHFDLPQGTSPEGIKKLRDLFVSFYLPVMLSENAVSQAIRLKSYGKLTDYHADRTFEVGGTQVRTFEFRSPSAEWLTTPKVALAVTAYLATVWHECREHPKKMKKFDRFALKSDKQIEALQTLTSVNLLLFTSSLLQQIKKAVKTFEFYPVYKEEIDWLLNPNNVIREKNKVAFDLKKGWGLEKSPKVSKKAFLQKKSVQNAMKNNGLSLEFCTPNLIMPYNDDMNVKPFALALTERIAAYGWKPKNNYFFFGLKEGTEEFLVANQKREIAFGNDAFYDEEKANDTREAIEKMLVRGIDSQESRPTSATIDSKTGRIKKPMPPPIVVFGIPYAIRKELKTKEVLKKIWAIENGQIPFFPISISLGKNTTQKKDQDFGLSDDESRPSLLDHCSQASQLAENAIITLLTEGQRENGIRSIIPPEESDPEEGMVTMPLHYTTTFVAPAWIEAAAKTLTP